MKSKAYHLLKTKNLAAQRTLRSTANDSQTKALGAWPHCNTMDLTMTNGLTLLNATADLRHEPMQTEKHIVSVLPSRYHMLYDRKKGHRVVKPMVKSSSLYKLAKQKLLSQNQLTNTQSESQM